MSTVSLSETGEAAWQSLRQQIEWAPDFWLGWIFTDHTPSGRELLERGTALVASQGRRAEIRRISAPEDLVVTLAWLLAGAGDVNGLIGIVVTRASPTWVDAWEAFHLRLNERREVLRRTVHAGVVLVAPIALKSAARESGPDLWSVRSLVLDVAPPLRDTPGPQSDTRSIADSLWDGDASDGTSTALTLADQALNRARSTGRADVVAEALLRRARAYFEARRQDEAREDAARAVEVAVNEVLAIRALETLALIEEEVGDLIAAERHLRAAIERMPEAVSAGSLCRQSDLLRRRGALDEAMRCAQLALAKSEASPDPPVSSLRDQMLALGRLADVYRDRGDLGAALENYRRCETLGQRRRVLVGDTPEALRDERVTLLRIGDVLFGMGSLVAAVEHYEKSLERCRQIRAVVGDTPDALGGEAIALERLGDCAALERDTAAALSFFRQSLALNRAVRTKTGDTRGSLLGELTASWRASDTAVVTGAGDALALSHDSLALARRYGALVGDTAESREFVARSLEILGDAQRAGDDEAAARVSYTQCLDLVQSVATRSTWSRTMAKRVRQKLDALPPRSGS